MFTFNLCSGSFLFLFISYSCSFLLNAPHFYSCSFLFPLHFFLFPFILCPFISSYFFLIPAHFCLIPVSFMSISVLIIPVCFFLVPVHFYLIPIQSWTFAVHLFLQAIPVHQRVDHLPCDYIPMPKNTPYILDTIKPCPHGKCCTTQPTSSNLRPPSNCTLYIRLMLIPR